MVEAGKQHCEVKNNYKIYLVEWLNLPDVLFLTILLLLLLELPRMYGKDIWEHQTIFATTAKKYLFVLKFLLTRTRTDSNNNNTTTQQQKCKSTVCSLSEEVLVFSKVGRDQLLITFI